MRPDQVLLVSAEDAPTNWPIAPTLWGSPCCTSPPHPSVATAFVCPNPPRLSSGASVKRSWARSCPGDGDRRGHELGRPPAHVRRYQARRVSPCGPSVAWSEQWVGGTAVRRLCGKMAPCRPTSWPVGPNPALLAAAPRALMHGHDRMWMSRHWPPACCAWAPGRPSAARS